MSSDTKRKATMPAYQRNEAVARIAQRYMEACKAGLHDIALAHQEAGLYAAGSGRTEIGAAKAWDTAIRKAGGLKASKRADDETAHYRCEG